MSPMHEYNLSDAPECSAPYCLRLSGEIPFLPENISLLIIPATVDAKDQAKFWIYKPEDSMHAMVQRAVLDGDRYALVPVDVALNTRSTANIYIPSQVGKVLGVVQDIAPEYRGRIESGKNLWMRSV